MNNTSEVNNMELSGQENSVEGKKSFKKKWIVITLIAIILAAMVVLGVAAWKTVDFYRGHYLKNTFINGIDCSELSTEAVVETLNEQAKRSVLEIWGRNENGEKVQLGAISGEKIGLQLDNAYAVAEEILNLQNFSLWFESLKGVRHSYNLVQSVTFDASLLKSELASLEALQEENMVAPKDAYIGKFSEKEGVFEVISESHGTKLDLELVLSCVSAALYANAEEIDLEEEGCYVLPKVTAGDATILSGLRQINRWLEAVITYDWNGAEVIVDANMLKSWISVENNKPLLDEEAIAMFVAEQAEKYDTYGKTRKFTTALGVELSLPSGAFGWKTDCEKETAELVSLIKQGSVSKREPVYSHKAPKKGINDIGSSYVEADLTNQHMYLYYKGELVMETDFVSGDMNVRGNVTPAGVFGLTYKTMNAVLRGRDYATPVTYWMPFHGNFGMHDATWRTEFGGDIYLTDGSHGCLNLPLENAAVLYSYIYTGYPVICYYY